MPGKKGVKLMSRLSKSGKWSSLKELVFSLLEANPNIRKQDVDKEVAKEYPTANFLKHGEKRGHFAWYKHRFMRMKLDEASFNIKEPVREIKSLESAFEDRDIKEGEEIEAPLKKQTTKKAVNAKVVKTKPKAKK